MISERRKVLTELIDLEIYQTTNATDIVHVFSTIRYFQTTCVSQ